MTPSLSTTTDVIDSAIPLVPDHPLHMLRRERPKIVASTQGSYESMFAPDVEGISVIERLAAALHACRVAKAESLATHYRQRLLAEGADAALVRAADGVDAHALADTRQRTILAFTGKLIARPIEGDRAAIDTLLDVGLTTPAIVALGQLIAFLSYQVRITAGLQAMVSARSAS